MTIEEATNVTIEDAIKTFEHVLFPQDFSPSTLRAKAINKLVLSALGSRCGALTASETWHGVWLVFGQTEKKKHRVPTA